MAEAPRNVESDISRLNRWWSDHSSSVSGDVRGLWFGLAEFAEQDGTARVGMYVSGTPDFDLDDDGDWACEYVWEPTDRYLRLEGLAVIDPADWTAAVEHAVAVVSAVRPWETGPPDLLGVGVGFDDGDVTIVWTAG